MTPLRHHPVSNMENIEYQLPADTTYGKYQLFAGILHAKWIGLVKNVLLLLYVLRMVQLDLTNLSPGCLVLARLKIRDNNNEFMLFKHKPCQFNLCGWLHHLLGLLPKWIVEKAPSMCTLLLVCLLMGCTGILFGLYLREKDRYRGNRRRSNAYSKYLLVIPSCITELVLACLAFFTLFNAVNERMKRQVGDLELTAVLVLTTLCSLALLAEMTLHVFVVCYICERPSAGHVKMMECGISLHGESLLDMIQLMSFNEDPRKEESKVLHGPMMYRTPRPSGAMCMGERDRAIPLSLLSAAAAGLRDKRHCSSGSQSASQDSGFSNRSMGDSNATFDSAGYGMLRRQQARGGSSGSADEAFMPSALARMEQRRLPTLPRELNTLNLSSGMNNSVGSEYQQIRTTQCQNGMCTPGGCIGGRALPQLPPIVPRRMSLAKMDKDTTYEVV